MGHSGARSSEVGRRAPCLLRFRVTAASYVPRQQQHRAAPASGGGPGANPGSRTPAHRLLVLLVGGAHVLLGVPVGGGAVGVAGVHKVAPVLVASGLAHAALRALDTTQVGNDGREGAGRVVSRRESRGREMARQAAGTRRRRRMHGGHHGCRRRSVRSAREPHSARSAPSSAWAPPAGCRRRQRWLHNPECTSPRRRWQRGWGSLREGVGQ